MKNYLLLAGLLALAQPDLCSQVHPMFQNLDMSSCNSGLFWSQTGRVEMPPDGTQLVYSDYHSGFGWLSSLHEACIDPGQSLVPDMGEKLVQWDQTRHNEGVIPISITELRYHYIDPDVLQAGWIFADGGSFWQMPGSPPILESSKTVGLWIAEAAFSSTTMRFRLSAADYFTNEGGFPEECRIDFDDGLGFRTITCDEIFEVSYPEATTDRFIRLEITRGGQVLQSGYRMGALQCTSSYDEPVLPVPWPTSGNSEFPWEIETEVNGELIRANAYYLPSGEFDKPFIFVEGIDFDYHHDAMRHGDFGWCQFTSGILDEDYDYSMLHMMPELLDEVRSYGYDIILIDFYDGATWIQHNSQLLIDFIQQVNAVKTGEEPLVMAGASMGGQITRYALAKMEFQNIDHCTRLWISLDSPHTGANVPLSLQMALHALREQPLAYAFIEQYLMRPAARQLLNVQYFVPSGQDWDNPVERNSYFDELESLGFPKWCRSVAIANGSMTGQTQYPGNIDELLNYSCELSSALVGPEVKFFLCTSDGDPGFSDNMGTSIPDNYNVVAQVVVTDPSWDADLGPLNYVVSGYNALMSNKDISTYSVLNSTPDWDNAPGGKRTSLEDFSEAVNSFPPIQETNCNGISDFLKYHSFISTSSALGIQTDDLYEPINSILQANPDATPFDRYDGPTGANELHSQITSSNMDFILQEILGSEYPDGSTLLPPLLSGESFNFGLEGIQTLGSTHVCCGGVLAINDNQPLFDGSDPNLLPNELLFMVFSEYSCAQNDILIDNMGYLQIGDEYEVRTGELHIGRNARLRIGAGGMLRIHPDSKLIIEEGGELRLDPGAVLICHDGLIEIAEDGLFNYQGGDFHLEGNDAVLRLSGGQLIVAPEVTFQPLHEDAVSGRVEISSFVDQELFLNDGSVFRLTGDGPYDEILRIADWNNLWNGNYNQGTIELADGWVNMFNNGQLWTDLELNASNVRFTDESTQAGYSTIQVWNNRAQFDDCEFDQVQLQGHFSKITCNSAVFTGEPGGMRVHFGHYRVHNSLFNKNSLWSQGLEHPSLAEECIFECWPDQTAIEDRSLVRITVRGCEISNGQTGIYKSGGELTLRCSELRDNQIAVVAAKGCLLNMSSTAYGGYNLFAGNEVNVELQEAGGLNLRKGFNTLAGFSSMNITGTIAGIPCPDDCSAPVIDATANIWSADGFASPPDPSFISLNSGSFSWACSEPPVYFFCPLEVVDEEPYSTATCGEFDDKVELYKPQKSATYSGGIRPEKWRAGGHLKSEEAGSSSNPTLNTPSYTGFALDSALVDAAMHMEVNSESGNDLVAAALFHEILASGLDRTNSEIRWKMSWGRLQMKTAIEQLFLDGELDESLNVNVFQAPVQQYVDVLNLMTDTVLTDSTYRSQFYLELDKGQLFRTLGSPELALEVFVHLGDCQLDSLEQSILNTWREEVERELLVFGQYVTDGTAPDELSTEVDVSDYVSPVSYISSNYYFGAWILAPSAVTFVECGTDPIYKAALEQYDLASVYPNPADDEFWLRVSSSQENQMYHLTDIHGRLVCSGSIPPGEKRDVRISIPENTHAGLYILRLQQKEWTQTISIMLGGD